MSFLLQPAADGAPLKASGSFTIYEAQDLKRELLARRDAVIDLSGIVELDGSGLQLLLLARRDAGIQFTAASPAVISVLRLTGLTDLVAP